jgi:hypothetical protein
MKNQIAHSWYAFKMDVGKCSSILLSRFMPNNIYFSNTSEAYARSISKKINRYAGV